MVWISMGFALSLLP